MTEPNEAQRNADWIALQRVFIGAQGASRRDDARLQRAEKLAAIGTLATFPSGFYVSGFEGAEDRRGRFVTVAVTDEDFVFLDGEVEPEPMRELGRVPRGARASRSGRRVPMPSSSRTDSSSPASSRCDRVGTRGRSRSRSARRRERARWSRGS